MGALVLTVHKKKQRGDDPEIFTISHKGETLKIKAFWHGTNVRLRFDGDNFEITRSSYKKKPEAADEL